MKTTVEISDVLLRDVRKLAAREGVTPRTLVERGLHRVLAEMSGGVPFKLRRRAQGPATNGRAGPGRRPG
jgi:hypothetical protein